VDEITAIAMNIDGCWERSASWELGICSCSHWLFLEKSEGPAEEDDLDRVGASIDDKRPSAAVATADRSKGQ
jgi:hypothetical protein